MSIKKAWIDHLGQQIDFYNAGRNAGEIDTCRLCLGAENLKNKPGCNIPKPKIEKDEYADVVREFCYYCPWVYFTGMDCVDNDHKFNSDVKKRIKEINSWIDQLKKELNYEK